MAAIDTGANHGKRPMAHDIPLVPFIDFLLCLICFLMITAVWSQRARLQTNANVPGIVEPGPPRAEPDRLHVSVREGRFDLVWKRGATVLRQSSVPRQAREKAGGLRYPALADKLREEWRLRGAHQAPQDLERDNLVVHTDNRLAFGELVAVLDAAHAPRRVLERGLEKQEIPAFDVVFATR